MDKKQELKSLGIRCGGIFLFCLIMALTYAFIQNSQYENELRNEANFEEFSICVSDGRLYWNNEEQRCFEKELIENECKSLRKWQRLNAVDLPDYINQSGTILNISECKTTLVDSKFMCNGIEFLAFSILEDLTYQECIDGFTIGKHSGYGYHDVRYLGKNDNVSDYKGMIVIPFDEEKCKIAYYKITNEMEENIEVCWKGRYGE